MARKSKSIPTEPNPRRYSVYVIELDLSVLANRRFAARNPGYDGEKACLYVGMTGKSPDERFAQHLAGYKASSFPRKYGQWLRRRLFERLNPVTYEEACSKEVGLAEELRDQGYAVWQA